MQKSQRSISSFFAAKPTAIATTPRAAIPETSRQENNQQTKDDDLLPSDDDAELLGLEQPDKRRFDPEDSFSYKNEEPPNKRPRVTSAPSLKSQDSHGERAIQEYAPSNGHVESPKPRPSRVTERTSKYLFTTTQDINPDDEELNQDVIERKEQLHRRFVKKLGKPDSIAEIKRRNHFIDEAVPDGEDTIDNEDEEEQAPPPKPAGKGRKGAATKKAASKLTPMEKQVLEIKAKHMDTLLVVEVGYKFRFFGEDARTAAKELGIVCIPGKFRYDEHVSEAHIDRFASASIPVHRLHVHVRRLVAAGHKVGIVRQLETAALKAAGDNRNTPFERKLTNLYTKGTYIDDIEALDGPTAGVSGGAPATGHLLCITETNAKGWGTDEKVHVGLVAVQPATGDIIYDDFEDGFMRSEIETRLLHISPCEFLIVGHLSKATEKLIQHLSGSKTNVFGDKARVERVEKPKTMAATAYSHISNFYADKLASASKLDEEMMNNILDKAHKLSEHVTICLSAMITHLQEYGLEHVFDLTKNFQSFSARSHMLLNGNTLTSLEIYRNQTDNTEKGSLFWILDRTQTRFGQRLLRKWTGRPLLDRTKLEERINAVEELKTGERTIAVDRLKHLLLITKSDLEKSLIRIYYKKCTRPELLTVLQTLHRIANEFSSVKRPSDAGFRSPMLNEAIALLPQILEDVAGYLENINPQAAKDDNKYEFFRNTDDNDDITNHSAGIAIVEQELNDHRKVAADLVKKRKVDYVTVAGIEYLIEIDNTYVKNVPAKWHKISGTKKVSRFHTPEVVNMIRERDQHKEALAAACDEAFQALLTDISGKYQTFRNCIHSLATLDCLLSLAEVANQPDYVKPTFTTSTQITVEAGRHPMIDQLLLDTYVPNDIALATDATRALLITGPNMGGKSSYVRQVALISIMGQIGSYVPARSASLGMLDAVFTRMGAFDNMMAGESTFMVELSETADILKQATSRSLVIMDELGRGTSTHDGVAIAQAVLDHVVRETKCLTLFITHYQNLSTMANGFEDGALKNVHMSFSEGEGGDDRDNITFLYEVTDGVAHRSYGLNVARLATLPEKVIDVAAVKSKQLEDVIRRRKLESMARRLGTMLVCEDDVDFDGLDALVEGVEQL